MKPDQYLLYTQMLRSRAFEVSVKQLWDEGLIFGEMHLGIGEEAIVAGIADHMRDGDAMALDHRGTPPMIMAGVEPVLLLREFLGRDDGLCRGMGGHMHLFAPEKLAASSGIVGAAGPAAAGFGLAAQQLRPGSISVAYFGEGAMNQGMVMEALNLSVAWSLPTLFVCKDNSMALTTPIHSSTGGNLLERARGFGMAAMEIDGGDVEAVWHAAQEAVERARNGGGPTFLRAFCVHPEGHFLGDPLLRMSTRLVSRETSRTTLAQARALLKPGGAPVRVRLASMRLITSLLGDVKGQTSKQRDPLERVRQRLTDEVRLSEIERAVTQEIEQAVANALGSDVSPGRAR